MQGLGWLRRGTSAPGQALLLAVIILLLMVLVGAIFVLTVANNLTTTGRGVEKVKAQALADAGIRYANDQLMRSPEGADWRPPGGAPPGDTTYWDEYEILRGWDRQGFTKYPDPRDPNAIPIGGEGSFLLKVEYVGDPTVDPHAPALKITSIGRPFENPFVHHIRVAYKPIAINRYLWFITNREKEAQPAVLGLPWVDINENGQRDSNEMFTFTVAGGVRVNGDLLWVGAVRVLLNPSLKEQVEVAGEIAHDASDPAFPTDVQVSLDGGSTWNPVNPSRTPAGLPNPNFVLPPLRGIYKDHLAQLAGDPSRWTPRLEPPSLGLEDRDPATGHTRWEELTQYSGVPVLGGSRNSGEFGFGQGIFIDNDHPNQRQDLDLVRNEWLGQDESGVPGEWQGLRYVPPGAEIVLYGRDVDETTWQAAGRYPANYNDNPAVPDLMIRRDVGHGDHPWQYAPNGTPLVDANGNPMPMEFLFFDYPANGVIYAEGNLRIRGTLPPDTSLTVVSGGSIYIEGNLLRPRDVDPTLPEARNGRIALLARDHVVLNPTAFFVGGSGLPFQPDTGDPSGPHHYLLTPGDLAFMAFSFGRPPRGSLSLLVKHAAADVTLPTYVGLSLFASTPAPVWTLPSQSNLSPYQPGLEATMGYYQVSQPYPPYNQPDAQGRFYRPDRFGAGSNYDTSLANRFNPLPGVEHAFWFTNIDTGDPSSQGDYWLSNAKLMQWDSNGNPLPGLDIVVSALLFAERGTFFIIPGDWFDPMVKASDPNNAWVLYRRYNYAITVNGAIVIDETPPLADVAEWANKWAWPDLSSGNLQWGSIVYNYDPGLLLPRGGGLLRMPRLPVSPELIDAGLGG